MLNYLGAKCFKYKLKTFQEMNVCFYTLIKPQLYKRGQSGKKKCLKIYIEKIWKLYAKCLMVCSGRGGSFMSLLCVVSEAHRWLVESFSCVNWKMSFFTLYVLEGKQDIVQVCTGFYRPQPLQKGSHVAACTCTTTATEARAGWLLSRRPASAT